MGCQRMCIKTMFIIMAIIMHDVICIFYYMTYYMKMNKDFVFVEACDDGCLS